MPPRRGRPDQGKTATIKDRSVYIYAPTEEIAATWKEEAKRSLKMKVPKELVSPCLRASPSMI